MNEDIPVAIPIDIPEAEGVNSAGVERIPCPSTEESRIILLIRNKRKIIKLFISIDLLFILFYLFYDEFFWIAFFLTIIGYYGVEKYNSKALKIYSIYCSISGVSKIVSVFYYKNRTLILVLRLCDDFFFSRIFNSHL